MAIYYIRMAWRNISKNAGFYLINVGGLALGLAACIMISHYVHFHSSFDKHIPHSDRTYRLNYARTTENGEYIRFASATPTIGSILQESLPQIEQLGMAYKADAITLYTDRYSHDEGFFYAESDVIDILGLQIINGQREAYLNRADQIVISESLAKKYFGESDPIGKRIMLNRETGYEVSAVFKDLPAQTHFAADGFLSMEIMRNAIPHAFAQGHFMSGFYNYLRLQKGTDPAELGKRIQSIVNEVFEEQLKNHRFQMEIILQPIEEIHLHSHYHHELQTNASFTAIRMLSIIAWFILIIAWANFFNLSSINLIRRMKETAIRQVNGAGARQIRALFLSEAAVTNSMAIFIALLLVEFGSPYFAEFAQIPPITPLWKQLWLYPLLLIAFVLGTLSALIYTHTVVKGRNISAIIKGTSFGAKGKGNARRLMLSIQFALALGLIFSGITVFKQYYFIQNQEKGFKSDHILVLSSPSPTDSLSLQAFQSFRNRLQTLPNVIESSFSSRVPGQFVDHNFGGIRLESESQENTTNLRLISADPSYFSIYDITLLAGHHFRGVYSSDSAKVLLNEAGVRALNLLSAEEAIGRNLRRGPHTFQVIGVVQDIHQVSPKEPIEPLIYFPTTHFNGFLSIQLHESGYRAGMEHIESTFREYFPHFPYSWFWLHQNYEAQNIDEKRFGIVFGMFSLLALVVTLLGIMGVASYTARQRRKEIAIRKTLGASHINIILLLFKDYIWLLLLASFIVFPIAWYWLDVWLSQFALRIQISVVSLLLPLLLIGLTSMLTVWIQSYRNLQINPALILKE